MLLAPNTIGVVLPGNSTEKLDVILTPVPGRGSLEGGRSGILFTVISVKDETGLPLANVQLQPSVPRECIDRVLSGAEHPRSEPGAVASSDSGASLVSDGAVDLPSRSQLPKVKVGRNDICPCGSGRLFKRCCGRHDDRA